MKRIADLIVAGTALLHIYIAWFEMFAWTSRGPNVFSTFDPALFPETTELAANQGIYNAFLAVGLIWSLMTKDPIWRLRLAVCFLGFVAIAGFAAAVTVTLRTGLPQLVPATLGLLALGAARRQAPRTTDDHPESPDQGS